MPADRRELALIQRWLNSSGEDQAQGLAELLDRLRVAINTISAVGLIDFAVTPTFNGGSVLTNPLLSSLLFSPDNTLDIGASGATRARDLFLGRNAVIGGTMSVTGLMSALAALAVTGDATLSGLLKTGSGPVTLTNAAGKILGLSATILASLDANALTNLAADQLGTGTVPVARIGSSGTASVETALRGDNTWANMFPLITQGRLTLTTAVPVTVADVTAAGTIFFTPYGGNRSAVFNGTNWQLFSLAELSVAVPATANKMHDVFLDYNAGVPSLSVLAWTNDTTRATALALQNGVLVKSGTTTSKYLGSFRTLTASQTEDSFANRLLWNYYNRVKRPMRILEGTDNWNYTLGTIRQANANAANQVGVVVGVAEVEIAVDVYGQSFNNTGVAITSVGVGEDSTTVFATGSIIASAGTEGAAGSATATPSGHLRKFPAVGYHFYAWLERSDAAGTTTWYGDAAVAYIQSGMQAVIEG